MNPNSEENTMSIASVITAVVVALSELPVIKSIPAPVKKILGDVLTVLVSVSAVLAIVAAAGVNLHLPATDLAWITLGASVTSGLVAAIRRQLAAQVAAVKAARATK
jgi:hypothetical protein